MKQLWKLPMAEQIEGMRSGAFRVEELTKEYLDRLQKYGGKGGLNVLAQINPNALRDARELDALEDKRGALFGLPILVKDNIDVRGMLTTAGSMTLSDNLAEKDAPVIENLRKAGAVILGKSNMSEFANYTASRMPNGFSSVGGQVCHAYDRARDPSGSSTGSAVAVSAGLCAAAIGTDTSFSIVGCAQQNGVTGLKPAYGALSGDGIVPIACLLDSAGPLTRTFSDALAVYHAMRGERCVSVALAEAKDLKLCVNAFNRELQSDIQREMTDILLSRLEADGAKIEEAEHVYQPMQRALMRCAFKEDLNAYLAGTKVKNGTLERIIEAYRDNPEWMPYEIDVLEAAVDKSKEDCEYLEALKDRERVRAQMLDELADFDACVMTGPTNIMHFCGLPSLAIRLGMGSDGAPRGLILYGADEQRLHAAALCIEAYTESVAWPKDFA